MKRHILSVSLRRPAIKRVLKVSLARQKHLPQAKLGDGYRIGGP
jgi:hypothetical protein